MLDNSEGKSDGEYFEEEHESGDDDTDDQGCNTLQTHTPCSSQEAVFRCCYGYYKRL